MTHSINTRLSELFVLVLKENQHEFEVVDLTATKSYLSTNLLKAHKLEIDTRV